MEGKIMLEITKKIEKGEKVALITITEVSGSSPGKNGNIMAVFLDGSTLGTVGGGELEFQIINSARKALKIEKNKNFDFKLTSNEKLDMRCGGSIKGYIKIFKKRKKLIIVGGGHLGVELYKLGRFLGFYTVILDDREEFVSRERFELADELLNGDIPTLLKNYNLDTESYVIIVSRGHLQDEDALKSIINYELPYIGMIGSKKKVEDTFQHLLKEGITREKLLKVYSPIGLDISTGEPNEIAFAIMAEILKIKNNGSGNHMKNVKEIKV
jgi:xanthine dehydrogenase accessory factor